MGHTKSTPDNQRPTLETLRVQNVWNTELQPTTFVVEGRWEEYQGESVPFKVVITGHPADVEETIESLELNGNLHNLRVEKKETH